MPHLSNSECILQLIDVTKTFVQGRRWERQFQVLALRGVTLNLEKGTTTALIGRSGAGKTTLAMCAALLLRPDSGSVIFDGRDVMRIDKHETSLLRPRVQMLFQDAASLPPRLTAKEIIEEPLKLQRHPSGPPRAKIVANLMERVGLPRESGDRYARQFSGGQRQRIAIARALTLNPQLLILDEPFAGLDSISRGNMQLLLAQLREESNMTFLFITHELDRLSEYADSIAILDRGQIVHSLIESYPKPFLDPLGDRRR
jgi:ABC-type glutathione transport system ATPase component